MPQQVDARETRGFASEVKFVVPAELGAEIRRWARERLNPDPHGAGAYGDEYRIASLYFDTPQLDVFHRRGSFGRCKYRVRRYGDERLIFFERKLRKPRLLVKRRTAGMLGELARLGDRVPQSDWRGQWFHRRVLARRLEPTCEIFYERMARVSINGHGPARLTLDERIRAVRAAGLHFSGAAGAPVLDGVCVLELKYRFETPAIFKQLVEQFGLRTAAASKYRLGMASLGHDSGTGAAETGARNGSAYA